MATAPLTFHYLPIAVASNGNNNLVAAVTGSVIRVFSFFLSASGGVNAKFQADAGGTPVDLTGLLYMTTNTQANGHYNPQGLFQTTSGKTLDLNLSAGQAVGGFLVYAVVVSS